MLFDELIEQGLSPSSHTYRKGSMSGWGNEMQSRGVNITQVVFNTSINGYCRKGSIDDALIELMSISSSCDGEERCTYNTVAK